MSKRRKSTLKRIHNLRDENELLLKKAYFEKSRFERMKFLINRDRSVVDKFFIDKTKTGLNVLITVNLEGLTIFVFDLDDCVYNAQHKLGLWANRHEKTIFIDDINGGDGQGHGELAMNKLFEIAKKELITTITGKLSTEDLCNQKRRNSFFTKMGFNITLDMKEGRIEKKLTY